MLNNEISALQSELETLKYRTSSLDICTSENYLQHIESLQRHELQLESLESRQLFSRKIRKTTRKLYHLQSFNNLFTELDYEVPRIIEFIRGDLQKYLIFRSLWKEYENMQTTIQPWLAMVETQLENDGSVDLIYSELKAYSNIHEKANDNFTTALETIQLADEDMQRQLHIQFENRWKTLREKLEKLRSDRKEIEFNNLLGFQDETKNLLEQSMQTTDLPLSSFATMKIYWHTSRSSAFKGSLERDTKE
eukprot:TRINITY_DN34892_c0_g1_i1.p1 TRINITY_DN34892_c0_g1~~TRINITY_DN34892_c0_g1_i1.p1  ORF type:complete len:250 (+),score=43.21 TRINITY_DN34892_c0_g1_i1:232-981(+)